MIFPIEQDTLCLTIMSIYLMWDKKFSFKIWNKHEIKFFHCDQMENSIKPKD